MKRFISYININISAVECVCFSFLSRRQDGVLDAKRDINCVGGM
jgi:hypothetical protein